jgi:hypothetical protein
MFTDQDHGSKDPKHTGTSLLIKSKLIFKVASSFSQCLRSFTGILACGHGEAAGERIGGSRQALMLVWMGLVEAGFDVGLDGPRGVPLSACVPVFTPFFFSRNPPSS